MPQKSDAPDRHTRLPLNRWNELAAEQTALFQDTATENETMRAKLTELERELDVWKLAYQNASTEQERLKKEVHRVERSIGSSKDVPIIFVLLDGGVNIFNPELLRLGRSGGLKAAENILREVQAYIESLRIDHDHTDGPHIQVSVYCNVMGVAESLLDGVGVCDKETFRMFCVGFNQAASAVSLVDVGAGKDATTLKIKDCMRDFSRLPQTSRIILGGSHDTMYTSTLVSLENDRLLHKIILLIGSNKSLAAEIRSLDLPELEIHGLFMPSKPQYTRILHENRGDEDNRTPNVIRHTRDDLNSSKMSNRTDTYGLRDEDDHASARQNPHYQHRASILHEEGQTSAVGTEQAISYRGVSPTPALIRAIDPKLPIWKQNPPPCTWHYLGSKGCNHGSTCRFAHDYALTERHFSDLINNAKKIPCPYAVRYDTCSHVGCPYGHVCPRGATCNFYMLGKCKWSAQNMHGDSFGATSPEQSPRTTSIGSSSSIGTSSPQAASPSHDIIGRLQSPTVWSPAGMVTAQLDVPEMSERERRSY